MALQDFLVEEFTQALNRREFRRLADIDLGYFCLSYFVDPPQAALRLRHEKLVTEFVNILYISYVTRKPNQKI